MPLVTQRKLGLLPDPADGVMTGGPAAAPKGNGFAGLYGPAPAGAGFAPRGLGADGAGGPSTGDPTGGGSLPPAAPPPPAGVPTGAELQPNSPYPTMAPGQNGFDTSGLKPNGHGLNAKQINKGVAQQNYALFLQAMGPLLNAQNGLIQQANTDQFDPQHRDQYLAPRLDALNGAYDQAEGNLDRNMSRRGLDSSSAAVSEFANLAGHRAADRASTIGGLYDAEHNQQLQAQAQLRDLLMSLTGRSSSQAASASQAQQQLNLQQQQFQAQQNNGLWSGLGGILGQGLGMALPYMFPPAAAASGALRGAGAGGAIGTGLY